MSTSNAVRAEQDHAGTKAARKPNPALMKPLQPSNEVAVVGSSPLPRPEVISQVWQYIKGHQLHNLGNTREVLTDAKLQGFSGGKSMVRMFEMNKHLAQHLS